jgi:hypothetical protein
VPIRATPGEYMIRKPAVDRIGTPTLDRINSASSSLPFGLSNEELVARKLDQLIAAVSNQPRAVYGAEKVYVDTAADFQRLQQMTDWAERGSKVA